MTAWREEVQTAIDAFVTVAVLAGDPITHAEIHIEFQEAPHRPPSRLPSGRMAVYGFYRDGAWLKIGKAGPKSKARYSSQHYNVGSAHSTLAASLAADPGMVRVMGFDPIDPGVWIKASTHRVNILLPASRSKELLSLLEAFLHLRLEPRFEG